MGTKWKQEPKSGTGVGQEWEQSGMFQSKDKNPKAGQEWEPSGNKVGTRTPKWDKKANEVVTKTPKWDKNGN